MRLISFSLTVVLMLLACGPKPSATDTVLDSSCNELANQLAACRDTTDADSQFLACPVDAAYVAKCKDVCQDPETCDVENGMSMLQMSAFLGEYKVESTFQNIPESWPEAITLSFDAASKQITTTGSSLSETKKATFSMPVTLTENNGNFIITGAVRHYVSNCSKPNMEIFVISGKSMGTGKQIGCWPIAVTHTYLPLQWCENDGQPKSKGDAVQFSAIWKRVLGDMDRCEP